MSSKPTAKALPGKPIEANTVSSMELNYTRDSIAMTIILRTSERLTTMAI